MALRYYREKDTGDYLCVDPDTCSYYQRIRQEPTMEGRAVAIAGLISSMCTTGIGLAYLSKSCKRIRKMDVPTEWIVWM